MIIEEIQKAIERIYALEGIPSVNHYLIEKDVAESLLKKAIEPSPQVLLQQDDNELFLGVFLGGQLEIGKSEMRPSEIALQDYCEIVEEVSHFMYLFWSAQNEQPRSLLDIEIQGELDKCLLLKTLHPNQEDHISSILFEDFGLKEHLSEIEKARYQEANRLSKRLIMSRQLKKGSRFLRDFYRKASGLRISELSRL